MAEQQQEQDPAAVSTQPDDEEDENPNYKPPAPKAMEDIMNMDAEDESLKKYKEALLGAAVQVVVDESNPKKVIVKKMSLLSEGRDDISIDLTLSPEEIKKKVFVIKEACKYKIKIDFIVQREIVAGLKYQHAVYRKGIKVDKMGHMMGSYGPRVEPYSFTTPEEEAPSGLLMRGDYKITSQFVDDDKVDYHSWDWHLAVKKEWS